MVTLLTDYLAQRYILNTDDDIDGIEFHNGDQVLLMDIDKLLIYSEGDTQWYEVPTGGGGGGGGGPQWTLFAEKSVALPEYTNTSDFEVTDLDVLWGNDYVYYLIIITCDSIISSANDWGMTLSTGVIVPATHKCVVPASSNYQQKGTATLSQSAMTASTANTDQYGVSIQSSLVDIKLRRKAHAVNMPSIRAGNYTVKVYALTAL